MSFCTLVTLQRPVDERAIIAPLDVPVREIVQFLLDFIRLLRLRVVLDRFVLPVQICLAVLPALFRLFLNNSRRISPLSQARRSRTSLLSCRSVTCRHGLQPRKRPSKVLSFVFVCDWLVLSSMLTCNAVGLWSSSATIPSKFGNG